MISLVENKNCSKNNELNESKYQERIALKNQEVRRLPYVYLNESIKKQ